MLPSSLSCDVVSSWCSVVVGGIYQFIVIVLFKYRVGVVVVISSIYRNGGNSAGGLQLW